MGKQLTEWRAALDQSANYWLTDDAEAALKTLENAVADYPDQPLLKIQKHYMEKAVAYREGVAHLNISPYKQGDPIVSVIMTTYDRNAWLRESIESVVAQTFQSWELVIVNDGGSDEAGKIAASYNDNRIRYINAEHAGRAPALNACLNAARGKYIGLLDDDDIYYPTSLEKLVVAMDSHPDAPVVYGGATMALQRLDENNAYVIYKKKEARVYHFDVQTLKRRTLFPTNAALIRREHIKKHGGFNEALLAGVDWEMWLRLSREGDFVRIPEVGCEFRYREDGSNISTSKSFHRAHFHNAIGYMYKGILLDGDSLSGCAGKRAIKGLAYLLRAAPDMINAILIHKLLEEEKPYRYFEGLSKELLRGGEPDAARAALKAAIRAAPHELRLWARLLKTP